MRSAYASAAAITSPGATTAFTNPISYARAASISSPVSIISSANAERYPRAEQRAPARGEQASFHLGEAEARRVRGDDDVATQQQLEAAADRRPVGGPDDRHGEVARDQPVVVVRTTHVVAARECAQVHARAERALARPGDEHDASFRIGLGFDGRRADAAEQRGRRARCSPPAG